MVNKKNVLIGLGVLCVVFLFFFYPTEKRKIKKLLKNTAEWAQKSKDDTPLTIAVKSKRSKKFFAEKVLLKIEKRNFEREIGLEDIERGYLFLMSSSAVFKVKISDVDIEAVSEFSADAVATVLVEAKGGSLEEFSNVNEVAFGFIKKEEGWRISKIEIKEVLEK